MVRTTLAVSLSALVASVYAFDIVQPGPDAWWVAGTENLLVWNCHDSAVLPLYTVFALNPDITVLTDKTPLIANLDNTQCSHTITAGEAAPLKPATGYTLQFVDPLNSSHVFGTSQTFEVKAANSPYSTVTKTAAPAGQATPVGGATGTSSGAAGATQTSNAAVANGAGVVAAFGAVAMGLVALF
ncbi:hypothetical protein EXIGLDRAFT_754731 [Exidia glandulosa HHB12029]|uniref:Uncharacterized protein n=1 Tax=Exidia glandulosa HHB12029 TaxID=1314781 RepID=A0A165CNS1_EXIGL|nr:hypothetical protein EXIGLDRAFT_754731 [Exidia glandulosa HHB12029]